MNKAKEITGYPSIDKPWLKYYNDEVLKSELPKANVYDYLLQCIKDHLDDVAIDYETVSITYSEMVSKIDAVANSLTAMGIMENDTITSCFPNVPESIYLIYGAAKMLFPGVILLKGAERR